MRHPQQKCIVGGNARNGMWCGVRVAETGEVVRGNIAAPYVDGPWRIDVVCLKDNGFAYMQHSTYLKMRWSNKYTIYLKASRTFTVNCCNKFSSCTQRRNTTHEFYPCIVGVGENFNGVAIFCVNRKNSN